MKIYHNNRCSKSRETLEILKNNGAEFDVFNYLNETIDPAELKFIVKSLGIKPGDLVRTGEAIYKSEFKGKNLSDDEWIEAMIKYPKLIERPIVINGNKVAIGRPPSSVLDIL